MTDFHLFVLLFGTGLGLQAVGLGLRLFGPSKRNAPGVAWSFWLAGVLLVVLGALRDRDLVLACGQAMGAVVLHRWLFR